MAVNVPPLWYRFRKRLLVEMAYYFKLVKARHTVYLHMGTRLEVVEQRGFPTRNVPLNQHLKPVDERCSNYVHSVGHTKLYCKFVGRGNIHCGQSFQHGLYCFSHG